MIEFINNNSYTVYLTGPDGKTITMSSKQRRLLPEYFERYCAKGYISKVSVGTPVVQRRISTSRTVSGQARSGTATPQADPVPTPEETVIKQARDEPRPIVRVEARIQRPAQERSPKQMRVVRQSSRSKSKTRVTPQQPTPNTRSVPIVAQTPVHNEVETRRRGRKDVGRPVGGDVTTMLLENLASHSYPISNNVGVGILSYNRLQSLTRLVESIKRNTDLRRVTVFISDDASSKDVTDYLRSLIPQFVVLVNNERLGVAGNSNRLMRCLSRFRHCFLLNDDVEITSPGWTDVYVNAAARTGLKHFCRRQAGIYGAGAGNDVSMNGVDLKAVERKPHGAFLYFDHEVFTRIGYFDEGFGIYGMEHVDWSDRAIRSGLCGRAYYDVAGAANYVTLCQEPSVIDGRVAMLEAARERYATLDKDRLYVNCSSRTVVPALSCIIPCRDAERCGGVVAAINGMRALRIPQVELIVSEHDDASRIPGEVQPFVSKLTYSGGRMFNKSLAFNAGAALASHPYLLLHDADILVRDDYGLRTLAILSDFESAHLGGRVLYLTPESSRSVTMGGMIDNSMICEKAIGYFEGGSLACRRATYWKVGGFNECFWGYGAEDCEFYDRLVNNSRFADDRSFDFVHIYHGRTPDWQEAHRINRAIVNDLEAQPMDRRVNDLHATLLASQYAPLISAVLSGQLE